MATLAAGRISVLLAPFLAAAPAAELVESLSLYLDLLLKWNARTNLTAIRDPEEMVTRHFGESLFAGQVLANRLAAGDTLLDFGSGAGFPGLPIALLLPQIMVTLAESQGKKATFLQEAVRLLGLTGTVEVWPKRVEEMTPDRRFSVVALRAVDKMDVAEAEATARVASGGYLAVLAGESAAPSAEVFAIPGSERRFVALSKF